MKRREFIALLGGATAWPVPLCAQQATKVPRIGSLRHGTAAADADRVEAMRAGLRQGGYVEGKNIAIDFRWAETVDQLPELAAKLIRMNVDVIFAPSSTEVEAARQATKTIPIVFAVHADPVGIGHVASLTRPGGNITGLTMLMTDLAAKELEILKEAVPQAKRIAVLWNPATPSHPPAMQAVKDAGEKLGVALQMVSARTAEDFAGAVASMVSERADAFLVLGSPLILLHRTRLAELALKYRLPSMFTLPEPVEAGGLMSYAADLNDLTRRAAVYIDKILKGAKPADLPVEQASKYKLVINLRTAKAIGLAISEAFLLRADKVIE
jgi:putative tryptophan/tyrosine transport system substrate-binding protein